MDSCFICIIKKYKIMSITRKKDSREIALLGFERVVNFRLIMKAIKSGERNKSLRRTG